MRVLVAGADGYIGFCISMHLANNGFDVVGLDNFLRRRLVNEVGSQSATPISSITDRISVFQKEFGRKIDFEYGDLKDYNFVYHVLKKYKPTAILHLGEQSSATYSMIDINTAVSTQTNNIVGTLNLLHAMHKVIPQCNLIKMGSMGEYGTPNIPIPEGFIEIEHGGRKDVLPFPKRAFTDWYHWSKVHDSGNTMLACEIWNLRSIDVMQGIVYGTRTEENVVNDSLLTRFDFDAFFGTVLNRFCAQAVLGRRLSVYGAGGQKRPFISLPDSIECLKLAVENPPDEGEYLVFNQFDEVYSILDIAKKVKNVGDKLGLEVEIEHIENPRIEKEQVSYYNPIHEKLPNLGFKPKHNMDEVLNEILADLKKYKNRISEKKDSILPSVRWNGTRPL
jgi:UDP-sulfoquinovose synthase